MKLVAVGAAFHLHRPRTRSNLEMAPVVWRALELWPLRKLVLLQHYRCHRTSLSSGFPVNRKYLWLKSFIELSSNSYTISWSICSHRHGARRSRHLLDAQSLCLLNPIINRYSTDSQTLQTCLWLNLRYFCFANSFNQIINLCLQIWSILIVGITLVACFSQGLEPSQAARVLFDNVCLACDSCGPSFTFMS